MSQVSSRRGSTRSLEALTRLSERRLVRSEPQLGFSVVPLDRDGLEDLTRAQVEIEP